MKEKAKTPTDGDAKPPYLPTRAETKLLAVMLEPMNRLKTVNEIVKLAGISRDTYYIAFNKPDFCELYKEQSMLVIRRAVAPMANALVREACRGSASHLKMALEIAGTYIEKHAFEHTGTVTHEGDKELLDWLRETKKK